MIKAIFELTLGITILAIIIAILSLFNLLGLALFVVIAFMMVKHG